MKIGRSKKKNKENDCVAEDCSMKNETAVVGTNDSKTTLACLNNGKTMTDFTFKEFAMSKMGKTYYVHAVEGIVDGNRKVASISDVSFIQTSTMGLFCSIDLCTEFGYFADGMKGKLNEWHDEGKYHHLPLYYKIIDVSGDGTFLENFCIFEECCRQYTVKGCAIDENHEASQISREVNLERDCVMLDNGVLVPVKDFIKIDEFCNKLITKDEKKIKPYCEIKHSGITAIVSRYGESEELEYATFREDEVTSSEGTFYRHIICGTIDGCPFADDASCIAYVTLEDGKVLKLKEIERLFGYLINGAKTSAQIQGKIKTPAFCHAIPVFYCWGEQKCDLHGFHIRKKNGAYYAYGRREDGSTEYIGVNNSSDKILFSDGSSMDVETFMLRNDFIAGYYYNEADCDEEKYKVTVTLYDENLRRYVTAVSPHFMEVDYDNKLQHIVIADGIDGATYKAPISRIVKLKLFDGEILYKDAVANFFGKLKEGAIRLSDILRVDKNKDKTAGGCVLPFKYITSDGIELTNFTVDTRKGFVTGEDSDYNKHKFEIRLRDVVRMEDGYTESLLGYIEGILPVALTKGHDECTGKQLSDFEGQCCRYDYQSDLNGPCDCDCAG